jgi:Flp pilus assembly protein TadD
MRLGNLAIKRGDLAEARRSYARASDRAGADARLHADLGLAFENLGDTEAALAEYERAIVIDPGSARAVNGRALLLSHAGRPQDAVRTLREALPRLGDDVETLNNLAWILTNESIDVNAGLEYAQRAIRITPDDPVILDTLGWAAIRAGRPAEAIDPLTTAWRETGDAEVRAHLGVALAEAGREDAGRRHVRVAVSERPALATVPEVAKWNH